MKTIEEIKEKAERYIYSEILHYNEGMIITKCTLEIFKRKVRLESFCFYCMDNNIDLCIFLPILFKLEKNDNIEEFKDLTSEQYLVAEDFLNKYKKEYTKRIKIKEDLFKKIDRAIENKDNNLSYYVQHINNNRM